MNAKFKEKTLFILEKLNDKKTAAVSSVAAASSVLMSAGVSAAENAGGATVPSIADTVTADMLNGIVTQVTSVLPAFLPTVVILLGFRKGISFAMGLLRGA